MTRGGKRAGAGRHPSPERLIRKTFTLSRADIEFLRKISKNLSKAVRELIARQIQEEMKK